MSKILFLSFLFSVFLIFRFLYTKIRDYFNKYIQNIKDHISDIEKVNFNSIEILQKMNDEYQNMDNAFLTIYNQKMDELNTFFLTEKEKINHEFIEKEKILLENLESLKKHKSNDIKNDFIEKLIKSIKNKFN